MIGLEQQISELVDSKLESAVLPLKDRIRELEEQVASLEKGSKPVLLTPKQLAGILSCSVRTLRNRPEFEAIKRKDGRRVYYPYEEVRIILDNLKPGENSYEYEKN